jgi:DNA-binding response OmpR family regulator
MQILLLEDNIQLAESLGEFLEGIGCSVDYAHNGKMCLNLVENNHYDALVLDITMPGMTGLNVCVEIRQRLHIATPLIFLTARDTLEDKLVGFNAGCDDYLVKPFAPEELFVRLKALEARGPRRDVGVQVYGDIDINHGAFSVARQGSAIKLHQTSIGKIKRHFPKIKVHDASCFPYWHLFYILKGVKVGYFSSINQLFSHNS